MDAQCLGSLPVGNKTGATRLGFAVLLKFFQRVGRFPAFKNDVPGVVISFVATQVGVAPETYLQYDWQGRTIKDHRADIRWLLDFRELTVADAEQMQQWLITEVLPQEHQDDRLREETYAWFRRMHLEAPTPDRLTRLIRSASHSFEQQLYDTTLASLPDGNAGSPGSVTLNRDRQHCRKRRDESLMQEATTSGGQCKKSRRTNNESPPPHTSGPRPGRTCHHVGRDGKVATYSGTQACLIIFFLGLHAKF